MMTAARNARLPRASLLLTACVFAGFGFALFLDPGILAAVGVVLSEPVGSVEIRAFYGGLELGIAGFFMLAYSRPAWYEGALMVQILSLGGTAAGRALGLVLVGGSWVGLIWILLGAEILGCGVGVLALRSLRKTS